jgi:hypothetical protein
MDHISSGKIDAGVKKDLLTILLVASQTIKVNVIGIILVCRVPIRDLCPEGARVFCQRIEVNTVYADTNDLRTEKQ